MGRREDGGDSWFAPQTGMARNKVPAPAWLRHAARCCPHGCVSHRYTFDCGPSQRAGALSWRYGEGLLLCNHGVLLLGHDMNSRQEGNCSRGRGTNSSGRKQGVGACRFVDRAMGA